jgi:hypothetical protein
LFLRKSVVCVSSLKCKYSQNLFYGGKTMKKVLVLLCVFAMTGIASANLVVNGDFEGTGGWDGWGSNKGIADHSADWGGTPGNTDAGVWWSDAGFFQEVTGIQLGTYTLSGDLMNATGASPLSGTRKGLIKADMFHWNGSGYDWWWGQELAIDASTPTNVWQHQSMDITVTANELGDHVDMIKITLFLWDGDPAVDPAGNAYFDNVTLVPEPATMILLGLGGLLLRRKK